MLGDDDETFVILDDNDASQVLQGDADLKEALAKAEAACEAGHITQDHLEHIRRRVLTLLQRCNKLTGDITQFLTKSEEEFLERKRKEEEERRRREEEKRRQEEERRRKEAERKAKEEEARRQREAQERQRQEAAKREEEARKQREEAEPDLHWRETESLDWRVRCFDFEEGAFQIKNMYEEALKHRDWASFARRCLEMHWPESLPFTWLQIEKSGVLKAMPNIFPNDEENPVVVPGFIIAKEDTHSEEEIFVIINKEFDNRFRYTPESVVRMSDARKAR